MKVSGDTIDRTVPKQERVSKFLFFKWKTFYSLLLSLLNSWVIIVTRWGLFFLGNSLSFWQLLPMASATSAHGLGNSCPWPRQLLPRPGQLLPMALATPAHDLGNSCPWTRQLLPLALATPAHGHGNSCSWPWQPLPIATATPAYGLGNSCLWPLLLLAMVRKLLPMA